MTPENLRFHAAGHLSAARDIVSTVKTFASSPNVATPPAIQDELDSILAALGQLEGWFVDPMNSKIEESQRGR